VVILLFLLLGCDPVRHHQVSSADFHSRFQALSQSGIPEQIAQEFSLEVLVKEAPALFPYHTKYKNLHLYSDHPFKDVDAIPILVEVHHRLSDSPIYDEKRARSAFICNDEWKEELFLGSKGKIGGRAYLRAAPHVFFTKADVKNDALLSEYRPIASPRTLTYYLTHEFTHVALGEHLGMKRFEALPKWVFEGYPEFVGLGPGYTAEKAATAYKNRDPRVHGTLAEDYMRYGLMVATYLEDHSLEELLSSPPDEGSFSKLFQALVENRRERNLNTTATGEIQN